MPHEMNGGRCSRCGLPSDALTVECPNRPVDPEDVVKIKAQILDYRGDKWRHYIPFMDTSTAASAKIFRYVGSTKENPDLWSGFSG